MTLITATTSLDSLRCQAIFERSLRVKDPSFRGERWLRTKLGLSVWRRNSLALKGYDELPDTLSTRRLDSFKHFYFRFHIWSCPQHSSVNEMSQVAVVSATPSLLGDVSKRLQEHHIWQLSESETAR